jgi:two-component system, NarL family, sensor histidine kinase EvgS
MGRRLVCGLALALSLGVASPAVDAAQEYRFKGYSSGGADLSLGPAVLSEDERKFLAGLPEIRVALQKAGAPPYETVGPDGMVAGYQAEVLTQLAKTLKLRLRPVVYADWQSVLRAVREGNADMVLTLQVTPDRLRYLEFTLGTVPVPMALFARPGTAATLETASIALEREYASNDLVRRQYPRATVLPTTTTVEALRAVSQGRADYYLGSLLEAIYALEQDNVPGIEVREILQSGSGLYHFGLRKDWGPLAAILNKGITRFRLDIEPRARAAAGAALPASVAIPGAMRLGDEDARKLAQRSVWRIGAVRGLAMLNDVDAAGSHSGISAEYAEHVARRLGVAIEVVPFDSVGAMLDAMRTARIDFIPFLTRTAEREREFVFSKPYFDMPYVLVARSDAALFWDLGSLRGKRLAMALQHPLRPVIAQRYPEIRVLDARNGNEAMDMVARGDADAAVEIKVVANLRINSDPSSRLRAAGEVSELSAQFSFATMGNPAALMPLVDRALDDVSPAERERMLRRWVAVDLDPPFPWRRYLPVLLVGLAALATLAGGTAWWMRRLAREVRARRRSDEQLDDLGRTIPGVVFRHVMDEHGKLKRSFYSSGTGNFLGVQPERGQTVLDLLEPRVPPEQAQAARRSRTESLRSGAPFKSTCAYTHPAGHEMWLRTEAVCGRSREGDTVWTGYVVDVTAQHELQERLAQEAQQRHVLLASASHELRAPTHTLTLALQTMPPDAVHESAAHLLRIATDAARTLSQLLDDVLDVARFEAGRTELHPQDFDLRLLIEPLREAYAGALAGKQLGFECTVAEDVPQMVYLDPLRLKQVLTNLLSNALKYTARGGVAFHVKALAREGDVPLLEFVVQDTGAGIPAHLQQRLFQPFASAPTAPGSTGLGLSICQRLMQLMGGTIDIDSEPGRGTRARITLPSSARPLSAVPLRASGGALVCDDDPVCRMLMTEVLAQAGHRVEAVGEAQEALKRWRHGDVRLLITDLTMPGLDGLSLIDAIRAEETGHLDRTAIIVCSGSLAPAVDPAASAGRHDAFLTKPLDMDTLSKALQTLGLRPEAVDTD